MSNVGHGVYQHMKSGRNYRVIAFDARIEREGMDGTPMVVYQSLADQQVWVRPVEEFDARFRKVGP
jgi:hypothetical protein